MTRHETLSAGDDATGPDKKSGADFLSDRKKPEKKFPVKSDFQIGQVWVRPDNGFRLQVVKQPSKNRFAILLQEDGQRGRTEWNASKTELEKMISAGYVLSAPELPSVSEEAAPHRNAGAVDDGATVKTDSDISTEVVEEKPSVSASSRDNEVLEDSRGDSHDAEGTDEASLILEKYFILSEEMEKIMTGIEMAKNAIVEALEKSTRTLDDKQHDEYLEELDELIESVNSVIHQETDSYRVILEKKQRSIKNIALVREKLESLQQSINQDIEQKKEKPGPHAVPDNVVYINKYQNNTLLHSEGKKGGTPENSVEESERQEVAMSIESAEKKIGEEKYKALSQYIEGVLGSLDPERKKNRTASVISKAVQAEVWKESLPVLQKEIMTFLQENTDLLPDDREFVCRYLIQEAETKRDASHKQADSNTQ